MGTNLTNVSTGQTIAVSDLESNDTAVEKWLNGEIKQSDINTGHSGFNINSAIGVVDTHHIRPGNFFGAPAPRTELVSSDVHFRHGDTDIQEETFLWRGPTRKDHYIPVKGLAATIHVTPKNPGQIVKAIVFACAYVREHSFGGGNAWSAGSGDKNTYDRFGKHQFAELAMFHQTKNNSPYMLTGTHRDIYSGSKEGARTRPSSTRSLTWHRVVDLQHGINHLYIGAAVEGKSANTQTNRVGQRLWCSGMNFIVDVQYL